jgi:hypothetical protein
MTEQEWFAGTDPTSMVLFLKDTSSHRKLRLFACACCRRIWPWLTEQPSRQAVEVAEQYADGLATPQALHQAHGSAWAKALEMIMPYSFPIGLDPEDAHLGFDPGTSYVQYGIRDGCLAAPAACAAVFASEPGFGRECKAALNASWEAQAQVSLAGCARESPDETAPGEAAGRHECSAQAALVRDIFGNPFGPISINPSWLTPTVQALALAIYKERTFTVLPVLADALEEAGCANDAVLSHLRGPGPHCRGCWPVDLILNKS